MIISLNGYPTSLIDNCIRTFLDKIFSPKPLVYSCSKKILFFHFIHRRMRMVYKYAHNFTNDFQKLTHIFLFVLSFVFRVDCLTFFHSRTEFLLQWDRILCINISVSAVAHCMLVKHADIYTSESQNIWEFRPKLEISFQSHKCLCCSDSPSSLQTYTLTLLY